MDLTLQILRNCSGKSLSVLTEMFGDSNVQAVINQGYIALLPDGTITKTETGMSLATPISTGMNEKMGKDGFNLITDSSIDIDGQLLLS